MIPYEQIIGHLRQLPGCNDIQYSSFRDNHRLVVPKDCIYTVLQRLKDDFNFDMLIDITAVDYLHYPDARHRFGVVYCLLNTQTGQRLIVKTNLDEPDLQLPSAFSLWKAADWLEREVYDMFGIVFEGHPDLRRILMPETFTDYPLRKDYPLRGRGERHDFPVISRAES
ncbi:MAG: NADH-quinone oxidoreductase subunit C [Gemmatales bacterium]|nr:NADH-quinone oxidoreductase subunit C [Gemmatales bacterium]MDW7994309.1 NADH-quinone oxidoreductase subunit C [Gemmatales bacterium]